MGVPMSSAEITMSGPLVSVQMGTTNIASIARKQRLQDLFFHRTTQAFSLLISIINDINQKNAVDCDIKEFTPLNQEKMV